MQQRAKLPGASLCLGRGEGDETAVSQPRLTRSAIRFKSPAKPSIDHLESSGNSLTLIYFSK